MRSVSGLARPSPCSALQGPRCWGRESRRPDTPTASPFSLFLEDDDDNDNSCDTSTLLCTPNRRESLPELEDYYGCLSTILNLPGPEEDHAVTSFHPHLLEINLTSPLLITCPTPPHLYDGPALGLFADDEFSNPSQSPSPEYTHVDDFFAYSPELEKYDIPNPEDTAESLIQTTTLLFGSLGCAGGAGMPRKQLAWAMKITDIVKAISTSLRHLTNCFASSSKAETQEHTYKMASGEPNGKPTMTSPNLPQPQASFPMKSEYIVHVGFQSGGLFLIHTCSHADATLGLSAPGRAIQPCEKEIPRWRPIGTRLIQRVVIPQPRLRLRLLFFHCWSKTGYRQRVPVTHTGSSILRVDSSNRTLKISKVWRNELVSSAVQVRKPRLQLLRRLREGEAKLKIKDVRNVQDSGYV